jgi:hypothetical protein
MHCVVLGRRTNPSPHAHALHPGSVHVALSGSREELQPVHVVFAAIVHSRLTCVPISHWEQGLQNASEMAVQGCK